MDSGVGGLSVLREVRGLLPGEDLLYVADSAYCPYGAKGAEAIQRRVFWVVDRLLARGVKLVVVACNSATIAAIEALRVSYPLPFAGMEPAVKPAAARTRSGVVGVLATEASLAGEKFHRLVSDHAAGVRVITIPCPALVEHVERGELVGEAVRASVAGYVSPLVGEGADVLVLGCTHYPFLRGVIEDVAGAGVEVLDTGAAVARRVVALLEQEGLRAGRVGGGRVELITTGEVRPFRRVVKTLMGELDEAVEIGLWAGGPG